jgi:hypothetical protein
MGYQWLASARALSTLARARLQGVLQSSVPVAACVMLQTLIVQQLVELLKCSGSLAPAARMQQQNTPGGTAVAAPTCCTQRITRLPSGPRSALTAIMHHAAFASWVHAVAPQP